MLAVPFKLYGRYLDRGHLYLACMQARGAEPDPGIQADVTHQE